MSEKQAVQMLFALASGFICDVTSTVNHVGCCVLMFSPLLVYLSIVSMSGSFSCVYCVLNEVKNGSKIIIASLFFILLLLLIKGCSNHMPLHVTQSLIH